MLENDSSSSSTSVIRLVQRVSISVTGFVGYKLTIDSTQKCMDNAWEQDLKKERNNKK